MQSRRSFKSGHGRQRWPARRWVSGSPLIVALGLAIMLLLPAFPVQAAQLSTRYATLNYSSEEQIHRLNRELVLSRNLAHLLSRRKIITVNDEVAAKIDIIFDQVQVVLEMFPPDLKLEIKLFLTAKEAQNELFEKYGKKVDFISFYSRRENTLYLAAVHGRLGVMAHELAHVVVEHYFDKATPVKVHEVLAQYAEGHITD